jgi:hypothetical protein
MSAADAKLMEAEYQMRVLQKDFITQPTLHCYTRMMIEHEPIQIASVFLDRPESWNALKGNGVVNEIRDLNRSGKHTAKEIDEQHDTHLQRFLNVDDFAGWIARGVEEQERKRRYRESEQNGNAASTPRPVSPDQKETTARSTDARSRGAQNGQQEPGTHTQSSSNGASATGKNGQGTQLNGSSSTGDDGQQQTAATSPSSNGKMRNNNRSRRWKRLHNNKGGTPPPELPGDPYSGTHEPYRPIPLPGGRSNGNGYEGRERGERT